MSRETYLEKFRKCAKPKYNEIRSCIVESCHNTSTTTPHKIFIRIPQDWTRRESWLVALGKKDTTDIVFCCEDHFDLPNDMENWVKFSMTGCKIRMKRNVVPYKLLGNDNTKPFTRLAKKKVTFRPKIVNTNRHKRKSPITIPKFGKFVEYDCKRKPGVSILKNVNVEKEARTENQEPFEQVEVKIEEERISHLEEQLECIKDEPLDIKDETIPTFELVQNYTNEYFLVPLSEKNEQLEQSESVGNKNKVNSKEEPKGRKRKIHRPPDENDIREMEEYYMKSRNNGIQKTEEVACNEKYHKVDIFTIFGKSVADQLRSFPIDKAISLQNKIQDLITEERLKFFREDSFFRLDPSYKLCEK